MRIKGDLSKTPGITLEKSEKRILHAAQQLERRIRAVIGIDAEANTFINTAVREYQKELEDAAVKAGAKPVVDSTVPAGKPTTAKAGK